ncbi:MAG: hypothetical protein IPM21_15290 [Acidobacteria bacterium]|nr:hypothetical protein [Acidobacteriota bacterium]
MRTSISLLVTIFICSLCSVAFGQIKEIKSDEYRKAFGDAHSKSRVVSRRVTQSISGTRNDKPYSEVWTYEYQLPDRIRYVHITTYSGKERRTEQIEIGDTKYCRRDNGKWELIKGPCIGGSVSGGPSGIISERFEREKSKKDGKDQVRFGEYITYKNNYSKTADSDGPLFWNSSFWVDSSGRLVRNEISTGFVKGPIVTYQNIETIEYDPNIKIEAPIP